MSPARAQVPGGDDNFRRSEGCRLTIGSIVCLYAAAKGMIHALEELKRTEDWNAITDRIIDDKEFFDTRKLGGYKSLYEKFRIP